jgi:hypothetical protein
MTTLDSAETRASRHAHGASQMLGMIARNDARQDPAERRMLYVLGVGIAGAIVANSAVFGYFVLLYGSC